ncbi:hypothetical protein GUJ93_ZPchr0014g47118 [Zizania palustris]|uniref:DRBM domain-containing protein n=1 Tax=Zizania palustris TaxID=103762 RepID=A0A8J5SXI7_ZIZPA|nr:hypothetical protein GUJ93_ZPchr0014g47118 [Zizania palustris]
MYSMMDLPLGMALVIDDRLTVWDEKDQCRVHVVPAFSPYYAPQAEANYSVPVLCVARNVACNVRGGFFKEFDDGLLRWISEVQFEDELSGFPSALDVSNYLISEDENSIILNVNKDHLAFDGMADAEIEKKLKSWAGTVHVTVPRSCLIMRIIVCFRIMHLQSTDPFPDKFLSSDQDKTSVLKENGFSNNSNLFRYPGACRDDMLPVASTSNRSKYVSERVDNFGKSADSVAALKDLCTFEGYNLVFRVQPSPDGSSDKEVYAQVEIGGQIMGKGVGTTWEQAKLQAAAEALQTLPSMLGQFAHKSSGFQRSSSSKFNGFKPDFQRILQTIPSGWDLRNGGRVP